MRRFFARLAWIGSLAIASLTARAEDFPRSIVSWVPIAENPVFKGEGSDAWDKKIRERGWVSLQDRTFHLYYTGYNEAKSPNRMLGHATSNDGIHWLRDVANPIHSAGWVEDVCLIRKEGVDYLFAEGKDDVAHSLTSSDGLHWTERGPLDVRTSEGTPIGKGPYGTPTVWQENGTWYLFYERGDRGVWLATSRDRAVWKNVQDEPVLKMGPEAFDKTAVAIDQVIKRDGVYYAFYHANSHQPWDSKDWTTCVARSKDLVHWEKYPGNPILKDNASSGMLVETPDGDRFYAMHPEVRMFVHPK